MATPTAAETYQTDGMDPKGRKAEQSEATRKALTDVARRLFADRGYADTATEEVVKLAGVTRGALYYHFHDKKDLFRAVYEQVEHEIAERIIQRVSEEVHEDPWEGLVIGCQAFLDSCLDPQLQRITLDASSVLDWEVRADVNDKCGFGLLKGGVQKAMDAGATNKQAVDLIHRSSSVKVQIL